LASQPRLNNILAAESEIERQKNKSNSGGIHMKTTPLIAAVFSGVLATTVMANQDNKNETHGAASDTHGSAMSENHQRANGAAGNEGKTLDEKMKTEVQDDWREDAEERREAEVSKPEQR
jgi:hypothetical protein